MAEKRDRISYLRLDHHENVSGFPQNLLINAAEIINTESIATYPEYYNLKTALSGYFKVPENQITVANGSDQVIRHTFEALVTKGDNVLLTNPSFGMNNLYAKLREANVAIVDYGDDLLFPYDDFLLQLKKNTKLAIIVNPNNPCGSFIEDKQLIAILDEAKKCGTNVLVDEAHLYFPERSATRFLPNYTNLIVTKTFSKLMAMAGLRLGVGFACESIITKIKGVQSPYEVNTVATHFAEELLASPKAIEELVKSTFNGKKSLVSKLEKADIPFIDTETNWVLVEAGSRCPAIIEKLRENKILVEGAFRHKPINKYIRVCVGPEAYMNKFWNVFYKIWGEN